MVDQSQLQHVDVDVDVEYNAANDDGDLGRPSYSRRLKFLLEGIKPVDIRMLI